MERMRGGGPAGAWAARKKLESVGAGIIVPAAPRAGALAPAVDGAEGEPAEPDDELSGIWPIKCSRTDGTCTGGQTDGQKSSGAIAVPPAPLPPAALPAGVTVSHMAADARGPRSSRARPSRHTKAARARAVKRVTTDRFPRLPGYTPRLGSRCDLNS